MRKKRPFFKHYKKIFVNEFKGYNPSRFLKDILAGLTVAAVALPLALAFGAASVDPSQAAIGIVAGMITAIVAGVVIGALGGGSFQISGPTGAMTVILSGICAGQYGLQGMFVACFMAGIILLIAGLLRFGKIIQFIPRPVITGFTSGIALVIALGQLGNLFGVQLTGETTIGKTINLFANQLSDINIYSVIYTLLTIAVILLFPKKLAKYFPGSLAALIIVTVVSVIAPFEVKTIGNIPASLINEEVLSFGSITPEMITALIGPAFTIAALGLIESLLCGVCAAKMKKEFFDSNVELIAQGIGNMIIPLMGGVPATAAIARTSVAVKNGGQTRITSIMQSVFLIICMFALPSVIAVVPYAVLAGILFVTAWKMNEWEAIRKYFSKKMWDAILMFLVTMVATVFLDLTYAIIIGVGLSFILMILNTKIEIDYSEVTEHNEDADKKVLLVYSTGSLFFANAGELEKLVKKNTNDNEKIVFVFRGITYLDVSSIDVLTELVEELRESGKEVVFTGVRERIMHQMRRSGFTEMVGEDNFYHSLDKLLLSGDGSAKYRSK